MNDTLQQQVESIEQFYAQQNSVAFFAHIDDVLQRLQQQEAYSEWITLMLQKASLYVKLSNDSLASHTLADVAAVIDKADGGQKIDYYTTLAALQQANGNYEAAFDSLHVAETFATEHEQCQKCHRIYYYKSMHYAQIGDDRSSLHYATLASNAAPDDEHMTLNVANALIEMGQLEEAAHALQSITQIGDSTAYILVQAKWLIAMSRLEEAEQLLRLQLKQEAVMTWQLRLYEQLCPLVKQLHEPSVYVVDLRCYYALIEQNAQEDRNTKVAAITHYFNDGTIQSAARIDALTRLYNRKFLEDNVASWIAAHPTFAVAMCDIDRFKSINDTYGHLVGDEVIQLFADTMQKTLAQQILIRYGGDEFIILWETNDRATIERDLQQLQTALSNVYVEHEGTRISCTMSIGVDLLTMATTKIDVLLKRADEALYKAKENGRNQYVIL